ncbi:MAG: hypothetical protein HYX72_01660 [Acidobacteria bacterium]|nr:hypothetical protein [Acidobacteriota bacterium]
MMRRASLLLLLIAFATAIVAAQGTQQPITPDPADPTYGGSQTPSADSEQMKQPEQRGDSDQMDHTQSSSQSSASTAIRGTIDKVDSIGNNVTIHTDNNEQQTLSMDASTSIKLNGQAATVADLKPGQRVEVTMDGQKAVSVEVTESSSQIR